MYPREQSVGEIRKKWLLHNDFLQLGDDKVFNRSLICLQLHLQEYLRPSLMGVKMWLRLEAVYIHITMKCIENCPNKGSNLL